MKFASDLTGSDRNMVIDALKRRRQQFAFEANVQKIYRANTPTHINAKKEYDRLTALIDALEGKPLEAEESVSATGQISLF